MYTGDRYPLVKSFHALWTISIKTSFFFLVHVTFLASFLERESARESWSVAWNALSLRVFG